MTENIIVLREIIEKMLKKATKESKNLKSSLSSSILSQKKIILLLKKDINNLVNINLDELEEILNYLALPPEEKEKTMNYIKASKRLLQLNQEQNTSYKISADQIKYIELFQIKAEEYLKMREIEQKAIKIRVDKLENTIKKYKELITILEKGENNKFISDINLIQILLKEQDLDDRMKRNIMIDIMKYNQKKFKK